MSMGQDRVILLAWTCCFLVYNMRISLSHPATWMSINGWQFLFTVFQHGLEVDQYWESGPNTAYEVRIWYTNIVHIILNFSILLLPIVWIRRAQYQRRGKLVYMLLFLSGFLWVMRTLICCFPLAFIWGFFLSLKLILKYWYRIGRLAYLFTAFGSSTSDSTLRPRIDTHSLS